MVRLALASRGCMLPIYEDNKWVIINIIIIDIIITTTAASTTRTVQLTRLVHAKNGFT
jgi:hypothetical protein